MAGQRIPLKGHVTGDLRKHEWGRRLQVKRQDERGGF